MSTAALFLIAGNWNKQMCSKSEWLHKLACLYHGLFINRKEQVLDTCNNLGESQELCWVKMPVSKGSHTVQFQLCNILEITKLCKKRTDSWSLGLDEAVGEEESDVWNKRDSSDDRNILWIAVSMPVFWLWSCSVALQDVESEWNNPCTIFYNCTWTYNYLKIKSLIKNTLSFFLFWGGEGTDMKGKMEWKTSRPLNGLIRCISYKLPGMIYSLLHLVFFLFFFKGGKREEKYIIFKIGIALFFLFLEIQKMSSSFKYLFKWHSFKNQEHAFYFIL